MTELSPLQVTAAHIRALANLQSEAGDGVRSAWATASFVGERVAVSHGSMCSATAAAVKAAEERRTTATRQTRAQSADLAVKLESAADAYERIDAQEKGELDRQMQPGG